MNHLFYKNIKIIRELKNLTREYVADELGMSTSGYGKIERGEVDLTIRKLHIIAKVLEVDVNYIFKFNVSDIFVELNK